MSVSAESIKDHIRKNHHSLRFFFVLIISTIIAFNFYFLSFLSWSHAQVSSPTIVITRPLSHQVIPLSSNILNVSITSDQIKDIGIVIEDAVGDKVLQSVSSSIAVGSNEIVINLNNIILERRQGWLKMVITDGGRSVSEVIFGRGFIFLTAGQSNSANWECSQCSPANPVQSTDLVSFLMDSTVASSTDKPANPLAPFGNLSFVNDTTLAPIANGLQQNVWYPLGVMIAARYGVPVAFIATGVGATSVSQWYDTNYLYGRFLYGKNLNPTAILWHQGETDILNATPGDIYKNTLISIINKTRSDLGYSVPWFVSTVSETFCERGGSSNAIAKAQADAVALTHNTYAGPNTDMIPHLCHFDTQDQFDQYSNAWFVALENSGILSKSIFRQNLYFGLRNNPNVTRLQTALKREKVYSGPITGNFLRLTLVGVKNFQYKYAIPTTGFVGPLTRAKLNSL